jgi:hypothetical protein
LLRAEQRDGMTEPSFYAGFADRVRRCQQSVRGLLDRLHDEGRTVAAYGAAAKGATLLNTTGVGIDRIAYVVDRNPHKHGMLMPGCRLPIRPTEALVDDPPDDLLLLAWNFAAEIVSQQRQFAERGGTFYVPVPLARRLD